MVAGRILAPNQPLQPKGNSRQWEIRLEPDRAKPKRSFQQGIFLDEQRVIPDKFPAQCRPINREHQEKDDPSAYRKTERGRRVPVEQPAARPLDLV